MWVHAKQPALHKGPKDQKSYKNRTKEKAQQNTTTQRMETHMNWTGRDGQNQ